MSECTVCSNYSCEQCRLEMSQHPCPRCGYPEDSDADEARSQASTITDNHTRRDTGKRCDGCNMPDGDGTLWVVDQDDKSYRLLCGSCLRRDRDQRDRRIAELEAALSKAIQCAWDGPAETVGTGCAETYGQWRKRLEGECRAALAAPTSPATAKIDLSRCANCKAELTCQLDGNALTSSVSMRCPNGCGVLAFTSSDVNLDTHSKEPK